MFLSFSVFDDKKKILISGLLLKKYPEKLIVYCKDFRVFHFCLTYTKEEELKRVNDTKPDFYTDEQRISGLLSL